MSTEVLKEKLLPLFNGGGSRLSLKDIRKALDIKVGTPEYWRTHAVLKRLNKDGTLNSEKTNNHLVHYWLRAKGERRAQLAAPKPHDSAVPKALKAPDITPARFIVLPPLDQLADTRLASIASKVRVEVSGSTLFIEYGISKLVTCIEAAAE